MKVHFFAFAFLIFVEAQFATAQVGIGISNPAARLDLTKPGGDTPTLNIRGTANISHFNFGTEEDTYIRGGKSTSNVIIADLGSGNVGIGTSTPGFPLNFPDVLGDKISLFGSGGNHYGLGIQSYLFQIHTDASASDIAFGYGSSGSFTETMRIKGNGYVGIGTASPNFKLDVGDRMRIRTGAAGSAGLYLNNNANSASPAFIGMQDDNHVGLWGNSSGWAFTMNTNNGALKVNGNEGTDKQVLASTGSSSSWKTLGSLIQTYISHPPGFYRLEGTVTSTTPTLVLSALTITLTVTTKSRLIISASAIGGNGGCAGCGERVGYFEVRIDGSDVGGGAIEEIYVQNSSSANGHITNFLYDVNSGAHTIEFVIKYYSGDLNIWSKCSTVLVLPID